MGIYDCHLIRISNTFIDIVRNFGKTVYIFEHKDICVHEQIQTSTVMFCKPCVQMVCELSKTVAVKKKTIQFHHPVKHFSLTHFSHDLTGYIFSGVSRKEGSAAAAFAIYAAGRRKNLSGFTGAIPDISKKT